MAPTNSSPKIRIGLVAFVLTVAFLLLVAQLFRWQIVERPRLLSPVSAANMGAKQRGPERGTIVDRNGELLAFDIYRWEVWIEPWLVEDEQRAAELATMLIEALGPESELTWEELRQALASDSPTTVTVARRTSQARGEAIASWGPTKGVGLKAIPTRFYPQRSLAAHVLGFVNDEPSAYYGVEQYYDDYLRLADNSFYRAEAGTMAAYQNLPAAWQENLPSLSGQDLVLTIDRRIQYIAERELAKALGEYGAESGTVIVMEPHTGAIWAMASLPAYDPNRFGQTKEDVLGNPAVSRQYEPGSTFKLVTIAAGLDSGTITPESIITDSGSLEVGGRTIYNYDRQAHGQVDIHRVMVSSLNVGAAQVALQLGESQFYQYVRHFGFGRLTEIDLANESPGTVKVPGDPLWSESDLATNSYGQGIAVTPLQITAAAAVVANGGILVRPHVVDSMVYHGRVIKPDTRPVRRVLKPETAEQMTEMMVEVVEKGATLAGVKGYAVAGKTGTADYAVEGSYHPTLTIASFVGFAPAEDPEFVLLVKLDKPKSSPLAVFTAAPTFADIARELLYLLHVPPVQVASTQP